MRKSLILVAFLCAPYGARASEYAYSCPRGYLNSTLPNRMHPINPYRLKGVCIGRGGFPNTQFFKRQYLSESEVLIVPQYGYAEWLSPILVRGGTPDQIDEALDRPGNRFYLLDRGDVYQYESAAGTLETVPVFTVTRGTLKSKETIEREENEEKQKAYAASCEGPQYPPEAQEESRQGSVQMICDKVKDNEGKEFYQNCRVIKGAGGHDFPQVLQEYLNIRPACKVYTSAQLPDVSLIETNHMVNYEFTLGD